MHIIIVSGGRNFNDRDFLFKKLDEVVSTINDDIVLYHGGANGADSLAGEWAESRKIYGMFVCCALWASHGNAAGPIRNKLMLTAATVWPCEKTFIAFKGGSGTTNALSIANSLAKNTKNNLKIIDLT